MSAERRACIDVCDGRCAARPKTPSSRSIRGSRTISCRPISTTAPIFFVLYVNAEWFAPDARGADRLRFGRTHFKRTVALDKHIRARGRPGVRRASLSSLDCELRSLIDICYEESWQQAATAREPRADGCRHRFSRAQMHQADVGKPRRRDRARHDRARIRPVAAAFLPAVPHPDRRHAAPLSQHADHGAGAGRAGRDAKRRSPISASISASPRRAASPASSPPMSAWRRPIIAARPRCCGA